jgi:hypothetical protein
MHPVSEAFISTVALLAMARLLFPWGIRSAEVPRRRGLFGELIIGVIVDITVLALGIFTIVTACVGLP